MEFSEINPNVYSNPHARHLRELEIPDDGVWDPYQEVQEDIVPESFTEEREAVALISHQVFAEMVRDAHFHDAVYHPVPAKVWEIYRRNDGVRVLARIVRWTFTCANGAVVKKDLQIVTGAVVNQNNLRKAKREAHMEYRVHCMILRHLAYLGGEVQTDKTFCEIAKGLYQGGEPLVMKQSSGVWNIKVVCGGTIFSVSPSKGIADLPDFLEMGHQWQMESTFWEIEADQETIVGASHDETESITELEKRIEVQVKLFDVIKNSRLYWPFQNQGLTDDIRAVRLYNIRLVYAYEGLFHLVRERWPNQKIITRHPCLNEYHVLYLQAKELSRVPMSDVETLFALHEEQLRLQSLVNQPLDKNHAKLCKAYDKVKGDPKKLASWRKNHAKTLSALLNPAFATMKERLGQKWDPNNHPHHKALEERIEAQALYHEMLSQSIS